jgi:flagellar hook protein FlgE
MDVIGNNVSNVNTVGFKRARVNFQDMISQQMSGAAKPTDELGGVNPKEVGLGMTVAAIDNIFNQGNLQTTGVSTDLAIQGNGFFVLKSGEESFYTRNGAFGLDSEGTLVNPANGMRVQGWMAEDVNGEMIVSTAATPTDLIIPVGSTWGVFVEDTDFWRKRDEELKKEYEEVRKQNEKYSNKNIWERT